uniref:SYG2 n=1 Tax=Anopheles stephensi TaxID=30069 RepID=M9SY96_ANOST|nr:sYG2 [Anopheles stephensi]
MSSQNKQYQSVKLDKILNAYQSGTENSKFVTEHVAKELEKDKNTKILNIFYVRRTSVLQNKKNNTNNS